MMGKGTFVFAALCEIIVGRQAVTSNRRNEQIFSDGNYLGKETLLGRGRSPSTSLLLSIWER